MEIETGEYVRTRTDGICKLLYKQIDGNGKFCGNVDKPFFLREDNIINHSKNIIDLLEEGDFAKVNACGIIFTTILKQSDILSFKGDGWKLLEILTKEQYINNCYKVKEE